MTEIVVYQAWGSTLEEAERRLANQIAWNQKWQAEGVPPGQWPPDLCRRWFEEHCTFRREFGPPVAWAAAPVAGHKEAE